MLSGTLVVAVTLHYSALLYCLDTTSYIVLLWAFTFSVIIISLHVGQLVIVNKVTGDRMSYRVKAALWYKTGELGGLFENALKQLGNDLKWCYLLIIYQYWGCPLICIFCIWWPVSTVAGTGNRYNSRYTSMVELQMDLKWTLRVD